MKLKSLIKDHDELKIIDVELTLWPGLPGIQFIGLPDQHVKESAFRIKSAIKASGYQWPQAQQILVNLSPSHLRKNSRGLELAVAIAYLQESGQLTGDWDFSDCIFYGELSLSGDITEPGDLSETFFLNSRQVVTGQSLCDPTQVPFARRRLKHLAKPFELIVESAAQDFFRTDRPKEFLEKKFSEDQADLLAVLAVGQCSALLAGPQGSGKSTLAQSLWSFMEEPSAEELQLIKRNQGSMEVKWRPLVKPHHSTPPLSLLGGGSNLFRGELSRADLGLLILDELLEFHAKVQESLREPLEERCLRISRAGRRVELPARFQTLATTNLCPCGEYVPGGKTLGKCRFSLVKCRSYSQRLSGPLVDRFDILYFTKALKELSVPGEAIFERVQRARRFKQVHSTKIVGMALKTLPEVWPSQRRRVAALKTARALADLDEEIEIQGIHIEKSLQLTLFNFERLKRWDC